MSVSTAAAKSLATSFLMALGMDGEEILTTFYDVVPYEKRDAGWVTPYKPDAGAG